MPADSIAPWPQVRRGAKTFPVRPLQQLLHAHDLPVTIDGVFGPETESAVAAFQKKHALAADGEVGPRTWPKLVVRVRKGSTGPAVRGVQEVIRFHEQADNAALGVRVDGVFGPRTDAWIRGFQAAVGTTPDGIVGAITWRALVSGMLSG